jgi:hypothetical protein
MSKVFGMQSATAVDLYVIIIEMILSFFSANFFQAIFEKKDPAMPLSQSCHLYMPHYEVSRAISGFEINFFKH